MASSSSALCSTCSSTLLPSARPHITPCCARPICAHCLHRNPRLRTYNPCLGCLAGVDAVSVAREREEEDIWVLGGEESDEEEGDEEEERGDVRDRRDNEAPGDGQALTEPVDASPVPEEPSPPAPAVPREHHLRPTDTLLGLSLLYKVDGNTLCRLNNLPSSTLRTTPHLLHTRTTLLLPPTASLPYPSPAHQTAAETDARKRERAAKRFQVVTKEIDWDVARAYVSLSSDSDSIIAELDPASSWEGKTKKGVRGGVEDRAVERYLEDEAWEAEERRAGRSGLRGAPWFETRQAESSRAAAGGWTGWMWGGSAAGSAGSETRGSGVKAG